MKVRARCSSLPVVCWLGEAPLQPIGRLAVATGGVVSSLSNHGRSSKSLNERGLNVQSRGLTGPKPSIGKQAVIIPFRRRRSIHGPTDRPPGV